MANSADPDQLASSEANWSGSTLFAKAGYIQVQQDKGKETKHKIIIMKSHTLFYIFITHLSHWHLNSAYQRLINEQEYERA